MGVSGARADHPLVVSGKTSQFLGRNRCDQRFDILPGDMGAGALDVDRDESIADACAGVEPAGVEPAGVEAAEGGDVSVAMVMMHGSCSL